PPPPRRRDLEDRALAAGAARGTGPPRARRPRGARPGAARARAGGGGARARPRGGGGPRGRPPRGTLRPRRRGGAPGAGVGGARLRVEGGGGSSIGSIFPGLRAFDWDSARIGALARRAFVEENPLGDYTLPLVSLLRGRRLQRLVLEHFDLDIEDLPIPFFC